ARKKRLEGTVVLQVTVLPSGQASDIVIVTPVDTGLSQKAVEAVSKWRFSPAHRSDGQAVPVRVPIEVTFRMLN
ncbi:MAG TPA: energy transducer TonB, partial [Candidatus Acidoferrales bacterium]|nr:energy transducer TonB [Candidatus Acidoferrales bacterium]